MRNTTIFILFGLAVIVMLLSINTADKHDHISNGLSGFKQEILQINALLDDDNADAALPLIDTLLSQIDDQQADLKAWLHIRQAFVYERRQHYHYAINSLRQADRLLPPQKQHVQAITLLQKRIDEQQLERNQEVRYEDARNSGMAKQLSKNVTIAYIYLDDNQWSKWSSRDRIQNQFNIEQVKLWYLNQASHYHIDDIRIDVRYFYIRSPKGISKEWLRSKAFFKEAQPLISRQLGYIDFREFAEDMAENDPTHEVALVFHSNNQARSFARSCNHTTQQHCFFEYVMLTEKMNNSPYAWAIPQVQAHEILHLFGASDLYNLQGAKDYAVTDLMNYYSKALKYATIEPITAWAIGWSDLPDTPFPVAVVKD